MLPQQNIEELIALVYRDDLTGLFNRRYFQQLFENPVEKFSFKEHYSFIFMDIDFFKEINDTYGHHDGDRVLCYVANLLSDAIEEEQFVVRYAGDEFILFLPETDRNSGYQKAREIVEKGQALKVPIRNKKESISLTFSIGVAAYPDDGNYWETLIEKADQALYHAKQQGRNCAAFPPEKEDKILRGDDISKIFPCPQTIGQTETIDWINNQRNQWETENKDKSRIFFLCKGARGSGKTRFIKEVDKVFNAIDTDISTIHLSGSEQLQELPYGTLIKSLTQHYGSADTLYKLIGHHLDKTEKSIWKSFFSQTLAASDPPPEEQTIEFFCHVFERIANDNGMILLIDDADLLDFETIGLLKKIFSDGRPTALRLLGLFTITEDNEAPRPKPAGDIAAASPPSFDAIFQSSLPTIYLKPLAEDDLKKYVKIIFPTLIVPSNFYKELFHRSHGNPLFIEEALKLLVQTEKLVYHRSAWKWQEESLDDIPESLEMLLQKRLLCLDPEVRSILEKASMMGSDIDPSLLKNINQSNEGHLLDLLNKACKFGILSSGSPWQDSSLQFSSRTAQKVSYEQIPPEDRITWHLQMAKLFDSLRQNPNLLQVGPLLYHSQMAGLGTELKAIKEQLNLISSPTSAALASGPQRKKKKSEKTEYSPIPPKEWNKILSIFHLLRAAIQNYRLYPETSQTVTLACERLTDSLQKAFCISDSIHFSEAEGVVLINGEQPPWKGEEKSVADNFYKILGGANLKDISFYKGLTSGEIKAFLKTWNLILQDPLEPNAKWEAFEEQEEVQHIELNTKIYVAVSDSSPLLDGLSSPENQTQGAISNLSSLLTSLESKVHTMQGVAKQHAPNTEEAKAAQAEAAQFISLLEQVKELLPTLAEQDLANMQKELLTATAPQQTNNSPAPYNANNDQGDSFANKTIIEKDVRCYLSDIISGDGLREAKGYQQISQMGTQAIEPLYHILSQTDDAHEGRICAGFLKSLTPDLFQRIHDDIERNTEISIKRRLIQYGAPILEKELWEKILLVALQQGEEALSREALYQLRDNFSERASELMINILPTVQKHIRSEICNNIGLLGDTKSIPLLLDYLDQETSQGEMQTKRFQEDICFALSHFKSPQVVEKLSRLLTIPRKFPWQKKKPSSDLRKAALKALERIGGEQVYTILKRYEADKDPWIRFRVKHFLQENGHPTLVSEPQGPPGN